MNKSWLLLLPLVVGCDLSAPPPNARTNLRSYEKIRLGMSKEEVKGIMDAWPGEKEVTPTALGTREVFIYYGPDDEVMRLAFIPVSTEKHVVNKKEFYVKGKLVKSESTPEEPAAEPPAAGASPPEARTTEDTLSQGSVVETPAAEDTPPELSVVGDPFAEKDVPEEAVVDDPFAEDSIPDVANATGGEPDAATARPESEAELQRRPYVDGEPPAGNESKSESGPTQEPQSEPPPEPPPKPKPAPEYRTWTDSTGRYQVKAALLSYGAGKARLRKRTGEVIELQIEKFSPDDQKYIKSKLR